VLDIKHISLPSEIKENFLFSFLRMEGEDIKNKERDNNFFLTFLFVI